MSSDLSWLRAEAYFRAHGYNQEGMRLFQDGICPHDVIQGTTGDCWLLAALSALAEYPKMLETIFQPSVFNEEGVYSIKLFDPLTEDYVEIHVDDKLPVSTETNQTIGVCPNGSELWVILMEKAWCRLLSNEIDHSLDEPGEILIHDFTPLVGGFPSLAMMGLTGSSSSAWYCPDKTTWIRMETKISKGDERYIDVSFNAAGESISHFDLWQLLTSNDQNRQCQFAARTSGDGETKQDIGIVAGHAYSIIMCKEVAVSDHQVFRLLKIRNPWGKFEWKGDWSDWSSMWDRYPIAEEVCQVEQRDDGIFWISLEDFTKIFNLVEYTDASCEGPRFDELEKASIEEELAEEEEVPEELEEEIQMFAELDDNDDGEVGFNELWSWLWNMGLWWVSRRDARLLLQSLDTDGSGKLSLTELKEIKTQNPLEWEIQKRILEAGGKSRKVKLRTRRKSWYEEIFESIVG